MGTGAFALLVFLFGITSQNLELFQWKCLSWTFGDRCLVLEIQGKQHQLSSTSVRSCANVWLWWESLSPLKPSSSYKSKQKCVFGRLGVWSEETNFLLLRRDTSEGTSFGRKRCRIAYLFSLCHWGFHYRWRSVVPESKLWNAKRQLYTSLQHEHTNTEGLQLIRKDLRLWKSNQPVQQLTSRAKFESFQPKTMHPPNIPVSSVITTKSDQNIGWGCFFATLQTLNFA